MERVFFPLNEELKTELDQIKLAIQGEQNGMASQSMGAMAYKKNYGVPYISLRKMAAQYEPSKRLANCLWNIGYRETMLLALLLFPKDLTTVEEAASLLPDLKEMELAEFGSRDLFSQMPCAHAFVEACLTSDAPFATELAYLSAARLLENATEVPEKLLVLFGRVGEELSKDKSTLAKSVANYLKQLGLFQTYTAQVMAEVEKMSASESMQLRWVAEEVRTFVEYTDHKK